MLTSIRQLLARWGKWVVTKAGPAVPGARQITTLSTLAVLVWTATGVRPHGLIAPTTGESHTTTGSQCELVFSRGFLGLYIMDDDGSNLRLLTDEPGQHPIWSPDGRRIAFISSRLSNDLIVINPDGHDMRRLSKNLFSLEDPAWSPDGRQIAFVSDFADEPEGETRLYIVDVDGGLPRRLGERSGYYGFPSWSPDGTQIAFHLDFGDQTNLYVIDADGSNLHLLTQDGAIPKWSPDGTQIAFTARRDGQADIYQIAFAASPIGQADIYRIDADGRNERNLTDHEGDDYDPVWSPDGRQLVFVSKRDGNSEIYMMDADGSHLRRLTNRAAEDNSPAWSPDGRRIAFISNSLSSIWDDVWVIEADGTTLRNLTERGLFERPKWSPRCAGNRPSTED